MRVDVQWTLATPQDWVSIDHAEWPSLPKKPEPQGGEVIDDQPGWTFDVCIQGIKFYGFDHIAIEPRGIGVRVYCWNTDVDDPDPSADDYRWGEVWELFPPGPDPAIGRMNTRQRKTIYTEQPDPRFEGQSTTLGPVLVRPWSQWQAPAEAITRHGIWVRDEALWKQHFDARSQRNWREWA